EQRFAGPERALDLLLLGDVDDDAERPDRFARAVPIIERRTAPHDDPPGLAGRAHDAVLGLELTGRAVGAIEFGPGALLVVRMDQGSKPRAGGPFARRKSVDLEDPIVPPGLAGHEVEVVGPDAGRVGREPEPLFAFEHPIDSVPLERDVAGDAQKTGDSSGLV